MTIPFHALQYLAPGWLAWLLGWLPWLARQRG
jgi:hypothetical protein